MNVNLADEQATDRTDAAEPVFGYMHSPRMLRSAVWPIGGTAVDPGRRAAQGREPDIPFGQVIAWSRTSERSLRGIGSGYARTRGRLPLGLDRPLSIKDIW
ncbi:MAG: hypothetical protein ACRDSK_00815 [Actinophytocola sp.]|uniref:hypothetical protein n=1 Tax=Actinophytocola sp. TaxID=1872138 RepID=UPI003D6BC313